MEYKHISVMLEEVLTYTKLSKGFFVVDCTLGGMGYSREIAKRVGSEGEVLAFDLDPMAIRNAEKTIKKEKINNIKLANRGFDELKEVLDELGIKKKCDAVVMDLGLSSAQLDDRKRGFSFQYDSELDMSFSGRTEKENITQDIINYKREKELEKIISQYGEERFARRIAKAIVNKRKEFQITKVSELLDVIESAVPRSYVASRGIHFATRTFQAFRMASNDEIGRLERVLPQILDALKPGARMAVVSFHSLEDRVVKHFFKKEERDCVCPPESPVCICDHKAKIKIITKKPLLASPEEIKENPRSRSAKLRIAERI